MLSARSLLLVLVPLCVFATGPVSAQDRVALIVGNSNYQHAGQLPNPANDATDLAVALEAVGFEVTLELDLDAEAMRSALQDFSDKASGADVAMVYYAGHGIEIDKQNYVIPIDAELKSDRDVTFEAISLDLLTEAVNGARKLKMVLLDACRNNPFAAQMQMSAGSTRSIGRGLTAPEPGGGTLLAYSAKGGTVAEDGDGRNSPFAAALITHLGEPGLDVQFLFRRVRDDVLAATNQRQEPFVYGSLPGENVYLVPPTEGVADSDMKPVSASVDPPAPSEAKLAWDAVKDTTSPAILEAYLAEFPDTLYATFAQARLDELRATAERGEEDTADGDDAADTFHVIGHLPGDDLNIRSGPGTEYDVVATIPHDGVGIEVGACRAVPGYINKWCEVWYGGSSGFAYGRYLADDLGRLPD